MSMITGIAGFPGYLVDSSGAIYGQTGREMVPSRNKSGHLKVRLSRRGKATPKYVHRIVFQAFRGEIGEGLEINHKDGDPGNNSIGNLEAVTHSENVLHSIHVLGHPRGKSRAVISIGPDGERRRYCNSIEAGAEMGICHSLIRRAARKGYRCAGLLWEHEDGNP